MKPLISFAILLLAISHNVLSQRLEVGAFAGGTIFNGDIDVTLETFLPQIRFGGGILTKYNFTENWVGRFQLISGTFHADEKLYPTSISHASRGYNFTSQISDISAVMEWHPFGLSPQFQLTNKGMYLSFYGFSGIGASFFNPKPSFNQPQDSNAAISTTDYPKNALIIPIGGGVRWHLNDNFTLNGEISARKIFSDYADGIQIRPKSKDYYFFGGLSLTYLIQSGKHKNQDNNTYLSAVHSGGVSCPKFKH